MIFVAILMTYVLDEMLMIVVAILMFEPYGAQPSCLCTYPINVTERKEGENVQYVRKSLACASL